MTPENDLKLYQVAFAPRTKRACNVVFLVVDFNVHSATYTGWTLLKGCGFDPRDYHKRPQVVIKTHTESSTEAVHDYDYSQTAF